MLLSHDARRPAVWFRQEFGAQMTADFSDTLADARRDGAMATARLFLSTVRDLVGLSVRVRADAAAQDLRYAVRSLLRTPAFTLTAILDEKLLAVPKSAAAMA